MNSPTVGKGLLAFVCLFFLLSLAGKITRLHLPSCMHHTRHLDFPASAVPSSTLPPSLSSHVPLEAHIMSKCPDARDCLNNLVLPAMAEVGDYVDFTLSYIGKSVGTDEAECKHGPEECLGNIIELCAADLYPDPKIYLGFTGCVSNEYADIPKEGLMKGCALEHGIDFDKLNDCVSREDGMHGMTLLRDSVSRSAAANVTLSCTVRLDDEVRCIRDGGEWKDCPDGHSVDDLVADIKALAAARSGNF